MVMGWGWRSGAARAARMWVSCGEGPDLDEVVSEDAVSAPGSGSADAGEFGAVPAVVAPWTLDDLAGLAHGTTVATNALRYNTDKGIWRQYTQPFDASLLKPGENEMQLTVPAGPVMNGIQYDYLRLEVDPKAPPPPQ